MAHIILLILFLLYATPSWGNEGKILTLQECFKMALVQSETLAVSEQSIRIAEAHYWQALGTVLPHLTVKATELIQDTGEDASVSGSAVGGTFVRRSRPEVAVNASQTLFQGFREFRALKISGAEKQKNRLSYQRAKQLLFADVARAYYTVLELEREFEIQQSIRDALTKRLADLKERVRLGKSRSSEVLATEAELAFQEAELEKRRGLVENARDLLGFFTNQEISLSLKDEFQTPQEVPALDSYLASLKERPDLNASSEAVRLAQGKFQYERGGHFPTLGVDANYYPYRVGFLSDIDWDVTFSLKFPLFEGGGTYGKVKEAAVGLQQAKLSRQNDTRQAELQVRQAYHQFKTTERREELLHLAETKSQLNYEALLNEYRLGLVNHLEVLESLRQWQSRRMESNLVIFQTKLSYLDLLIASGRMPL